MQPAPESPPPPPSCPPAVVTILAWLAWAFFGFLHGGHWLVIYFCVAHHPAERRRALLHFAGIITGILLTALGGGYVRMDGKHTDCTNSTGSMGRDCLWDRQSGDYQIVYTLHYIGLAWCIVSWVYDAAQLPGWLSQGTGQQPLRICYSAWPFTSPAYLLLTAFAVFWITLSWAAFVDWKTADNGLQGLAAVLILVGAIIGFAGCGLMHARRPKPRDHQAPSSVKPDGPNP